MADASVIVTCFNLERYIGAAIESVLAQSFAGNLEIIVVDDCSTDRSAEIIRSYAGVRYLKTERNRGVLLATLVGLEAASADILFFLDGDDLWHPDKVAAVAPRFVENPGVGFITHDLAFIDAEGAPLDRQSVPSRKMANVQQELYGEIVRRGILEIDDYVWLGSAFAVRRSVIGLDEFIEFARNLKNLENTYQDWPLAYWIAAQKGVSLGYVSAKLFDYRIHQLNYSGDARTPERAIRNLTRALNTNLAIRQIVLLRGLSQRIFRIVDERIRFCEYLIDLNRGKRGRALRGFLRNAPELFRRGVLTKEAVRFLAVQVVGPVRFARLAADRKVLRALPVT
jgi:glycosyltransferase involved in cell wall biosynthesis